MKNKNLKALLSAMQETQSAEFENLTTEHAEQIRGGPESTADLLCMFCRQVLKLSRLSFLHSAKKRFEIFVFHNKKGLK